MATSMRKALSRLAAQKASAARVSAALEVARKAASDNCCPSCGQGVMVNPALPGWVQCLGYADPSMMGDEHKVWMAETGREIKRCGWQGFTR